MGVSSGGKTSEVTLFTIDGAADVAEDESNQEMDLCRRGKQVPCHVALVLAIIVTCLPYTRIKWKRQSVTYGD